MIRTGKTLWAKLPASVVGVWAACVWSTCIIAQPPSTHLPTAVISSGGTGLEASAFPADSRDAANASPWTADRNPVSAQLRPNASQAYPPQPGNGSSVVTANSQQLVPNGNRNPAAAQAVSLGAPAGDNDVDGAKHIPLPPPSDRFRGETPAAASSTLQTIFSVGSSLLLVLGLFLGVAWCYRKTLSSTVGGGLPKQVVQVMGRTSLAARQQMVLVRFGSKLLLVSVIQGEARTLSEITDPLEVDQMVGLCESGQPGSISQSFKSVLLQEGNR